MNIAGRKKIKPTNGVLGSIAGKLASTSHLVRDKTERFNFRVHGHWAKPDHLPTKTVDEEFEDLVEELDAITEACNEMLRLHKHYISIYTEVMLSSQRIANSIQVLSSPTTLQGSSAVANGTKLTLCERTKSYAATMIEIGICLKESLRSIPQNLDERVKSLLLCSEKIHEHVASRDKALMGFDKVYDRFDSMTILSTTSEFTPKQKVEYSTLEKKLVELRKAYDDHNSLLKNELPCFFMIVRSFIEPLMSFLFFVQLTAAYQVQSNLAPVQHQLDEKDVDENYQIPASQTSVSKPPVSGLHDDMSVILPENGVNGASEKASKRKKPPTSQHTPDSKKPNTASSDSEKSPGKDVVGYCKALFNFCSVTNADLEFQKNDVIKLHTCEGEWWTGSLDGKEGIFPSVYVEKL